ncbi:MAG: hypothetical protein JOZ08_17770 [Verrucomicrobia bacterium]|nr:hypothetical protein [Verrucomicrobiota bacterium]
MAKIATGSGLLELGERSFSDLTGVERLLLTSVGDGKEANCTGFAEPERVIRGEVFAWLCADPNAAKEVSYAGVALLGAQIEGVVDLDWARVGFPLRLSQCIFKEELLLRNSQLQGLYFIDTTLKRLNASGATIDGTLLLRKAGQNGCRAEQGIDLTSATVTGNLECYGSEFLGDGDQLALAANSLKVEGYVSLRGLKTNGGVSFTGASIRQFLDFDGGYYTGSEKFLALTVNAARIEGGMSMRGCLVVGGASLACTNITGYLECDNGAFAGRDQIPALGALSLKVEGYVSLQSVKTRGGVNFTGANIRQVLTCDGGYFTGSEKVLAFTVNSARIEGGMSMRDCTMDGGVNLVGSNIFGFLECSESRFRSSGQVAALNANSIEVEGYVSLRRLNSTGLVDLTSAVIRGSLVCDGAQLIGNDNGLALKANGLKVRDYVSLGVDSYLPRASPVAFKAVGGVNLVCAEIAGNLECVRGEFVGNGEVAALEAGGATIGGSVYFTYGFKGTGGIRLVGATIAGSLECDGGCLIGSDKMPALNANGVKVDGDVFFRREMEVEGEVRFGAATVGRNFQWWRVKSPEKAALDLRFTKVMHLRNDRDSWPPPGKLKLNGFTYEQIDANASPDAKTQLAWLNRQSKEKFLPQPYEQLAAVLRKQGLDEDSRRVMVAKNEDHAKHVRWPAWLWYSFFGRLVGYGYRPLRAFAVSVLLIVIGTLIFEAGYYAKIVTPTEEKAYAVYIDKGGKGDHFEHYPVFNPLVYSIETFVPLLKLGVSDRWTPNANLGGTIAVGGFALPMTWGALLQGYLYFHIVFGWVLTALWAGAISGLLKT